MGFLYKPDGEAGYERVADLVAWEVANNSDADEPGNAQPDSNPNSVALTADGAAVADSGGNDLVLVDSEGNLSLGAVFPVSMTPFSPDPGAEEQAIRSTPCRPRWPSGLTVPSTWAC